MKNLAWVAGSKAVGYRVCLEYLDDRTAQDIANAINASIKAKGAAK